MKNRLQKLLDPDLSKQEEDKILEELIKTQHDNELKTRWEKKLSEEYGIDRDTIQLKKNKSSASKYIRLFIAAAACIALIVTVQLLNTDTANDLAQQYVTQQEILHPGASKGVINEDQNRTLAIQEFNNKNYRQSILYFESLHEVNEEDRYYHGLALLLSDQYRESIQKFEAISDRKQFRQEINWYQSLAYILNKQENKAQKLLQQIGTNDWNHKKAKKILEVLDKK